ncbi:hypothetical protein IO689_004886 [Salmonella enterica subsp. enterica serovar Enteritidis]|nr:hypothetical protein [Salmonella enterica subsp. enterica serovar Enteritidis]EGK6916813.1 hypothetical protein [Salmonella enterica subsp. enterica serovar Enteritidis]
MSNEMAVVTPEQVERIATIVAREGVCKSGGSDVYRLQSLNLRGTLVPLFMEDK